MARAITFCKAVTVPTAGTMGGVVVDVVVVVVDAAFSSNQRASVGCTMRMIPCLGCTDFPNSFGGDCCLRGRPILRLAPGVAWGASDDDDDDDDEVEVEFVSDSRNDDLCCFIASGTSQSGSVKT